MKKLLKTILLSLEVSIGLEAFSQTITFPIQYHQGWGASSTGSGRKWFSDSWYGGPTSFEVFEIWRDAAGNSMPIGIGNWQSHKIRLDTLYTVVVYYQKGYIPGQDKQQSFGWPETGMFAVEYFDARWPGGFHGITLPLPPYGDLYEMNPMGSPTYQDRVYGIKYKFMFISNPYGPPIVYGTSVKTYWANPYSPPNYWTVFNYLGAGE